jgi:hypothetical protein
MTAPTANPDEIDAADVSAELTEQDLECVVGGLARPWTETDVDEWFVEPAAGLV